MIGSTISHFEILDKLGEGGMGVVYKARDKRLDRLVAIKVLSAKTVSNRERELRFVQEAKSASALNHPNIVTVHEIDTTGEIAFIAMEYVEGRTLDQLIPQRGMRLAEALKYSVQIADALSTAHAAGIIHRDIKPANIMVTEKGLVKVLDFGLAKLTEQGVLENVATVSLSPQTEEGSILGTVTYMSPEQAEGKKIDPRSDIFSFGVVLYEMLTGRRAFTGDTKLSTLAAILNHEPKPAGEIVENFPRDLDRILSRCLRKDPARRFQTMADLKVALEELKEESDSGRLTQSAITPARRRVSPALISVLAVVALAAAGLTWLLVRSAPKPEAAVKVVPLTTYPGSERSPTFSPDGMQVAFSWNGEKQDNYDIYVKMVDSGGAPLRLTTNPEPDRKPAWSPNGRHIAFVRGKGVYLISPLGGPERKLCELHTTGQLDRFRDEGSDLSWTPDSKSLAVMDQLATTEPYKIFLLSIDTGETRPLTDPPAHTLGDGSPSFSPDGRMLAFARYANQSAADLFLTPASGGKVTRLTSDNISIGEIAWTPDGGDLIFASARLASRALWRLHANASKGAEPTRVPSTEGAGQYFAVSGAGSSMRLAYERYTSDYDVWRLDLPHADHATRLIASTRSEYGASYSPNAKRIVFASARSGMNEIWVCDADGGNAVQLTSLGTYAGSPQWSPDGLRITFDGLNAGNRDVYVIGAEGGTPRRMTTEPSEESRPSWSGDGHWIYFTSNRSGSRQIWKMPSEGGSAIQLTKQGGYEPRESSDGRLLYYIKGRNAPGLRSTPVGGGEEVTVLESVWLGHWGLTDGGVYFIDFSTAPTNATKRPLKFYSFKTRQVTEAGMLDYTGRSIVPVFSVNRNGRWALLARADHEDSDLILLENLR
jgi:serine/threonine protein kinase